MAFLHKKHHSPSNYPPTHRLSFPSPSPFQLDDRKIVKVEESRRLKNLAANMRPPPISHDDELLQAYRFVEEPLRFSFGGGSYGNRLFMEAEKEILYERVNYGRRRRLLNHLREDMYAFSSEAEMIASFIREGLF